MPGYRLAFDNTVAQSIPELETAAHFEHNVSKFDPLIFFEDSQDQDQNEQAPPSQQAVKAVGTGGVNASLSSSSSVAVSFAPMRASADGSAVKESQRATRFFHARKHKSDLANASTLATQCPRAKCALTEASGRCQ